MQTWQNYQNTPEIAHFYIVDTHKTRDFTDDYLMFYLLWDWVTDLRGNQGGGIRSSSDQAWEGRGSLR